MSYHFEFHLEEYELFTMYTNNKRYIIFYFQHSAENSAEWKAHDPHILKMEVQNLKKVNVPFIYPMRT